MRSRSIEMAVGLFLVIGFVALFFLAIRVSGLAGETGRPSYQVTASFQNAGGLTVRAKVTMAGVVIGRVTDIRLDPATLKARVTMDIFKEVNEISTDAVASILTAGLLGEKYIGIVPGADDTYLKNGDEIEQTQSALVLEDLIGKFLSSQMNKPASAPAADDF
ncbi:MAG: outer membrane lipid asymmetry maintenance protein MlaD [Moraxellaceae bacterium]